MQAHELAVRLAGGLEITLLKWFSSRETEASARRTRQRITALSIFPSASGLFPLGDLALPGGFKDELGLADLLDTARIEGLRDFLVHLGAEELTFLRYVRAYLPRAFQEQADRQNVDNKLRCVELLAERFGTIEDDLTKTSLQSLPVIKCTDGVFRRPTEVYFANQLNIAILGPEIHRAAWSKDSSLKESVSRLYRWLGVSSAPRDDDLVARIKSLSPPSAASREVVVQVLKHLHSVANGDGSRLDGVVNRLRAVSWLPVKGDETRWYRPDELFLEYRSYLFLSQAQFIDLPAQTQRDYSALLQNLGVGSEPDVSMVVRHLLHCVESRTDVKEEVYRFLNDNAADARIRTLQKKSCIAVPGRGYFQPDQVFWSEHPFGSYRQQLGPNLRRYSELFGVLGVRENPVPADARRVLLEISEGKGQTHLPLGNDDAIVMNCWRLLSSGLERGEDVETELALLRNRDVVPDARGVLTRPSWLYFDDRAGFKTKFGRYLENNLIPRPAGADAALHLAGVRSINEVVEAQLTHQPNIIAGFDLRQHISSRRSQLERVLAFHEIDAQTATSRIDSVEFTCVDDIRVRYLAHVFGLNEPVPSEEEHLRAHFDGTNTFYFVGNGQLSWREIAKDLALLTCPEREPGSLAVSIKEVLASTSSLEAESFLNDFGFPQATVSISEVPGQPPVEHIGIENGEATLDAGDGATAGIQGNPEHPHEVTGSGAINLGAAHGGAGSPAGFGSAASRRPSGQPQRRLPVYVGTGNGESEPMDAEARERRREVDQKGVDRVMQAERDAGRQPRLMPHEHEGFDIEVRNEEGDVERLIEVKSTASSWRERGVGLSREQFNEAEDAGIKYWLYVVEKALDDDYVIHRIQNPAKQANEFVYDGGWRLLNSD